MLVCVDRPRPKEEGRQKSYKDGSVSRIGGGGGGREMVQNIVVDPQLLIMVIFGDLVTSACSYNLRCPTALYGR